MTASLQGAIAAVPDRFRFLKSLPRHWLRLTLFVWGFSFIILGTFPLVVGWGDNQPWILAWLTLIVLSGAALSLLLSKLALRIADMHWLLQAILLFTGAFVIAACQALFDHVVWAAFDSKSGETLRAFVHGIIFNLGFYVWIFGAYAIGLNILLVFQRARERDAEIARTRLAAGRAKLAALRYQVRPDVLFATLATAAEKVDKGEDAEAGKLVDRLSGFMRGQLAADSEAESTLGDELEALDDYLALERSRTGAAIELNVSSVSALDEIEGPTFLIQPLVEKRLSGLFEAGVGTVRVDVAVKREDRRVVVTIRDDAGLPPDGDFADIRHRMQLQYGADADLSLARTGFSARLDLPVQ